MATQSEINAALGLPPGINPDGSWNAQDYIARKVSGQPDTQAQVDAANAANPYSAQNMARVDITRPGQYVQDAGGNYVALSPNVAGFDATNPTALTYLGELRARGGNDTTSQAFNATATPAQKAEADRLWSIEKARLEEIDRQNALQAQQSQTVPSKTYTDSEITKALSDLRYTDPNASLQNIFTAASGLGIPKEQVTKNLSAFTYTAENVDKLAKQILAQNTTNAWKGDVKPETAARYMADDLAKSGVTDISQVGKGDTGIINTVTGEKLVSGYGERTKGNLWSGSYEGKGNTGFGVQFTETGKPIFYTEGASSSTLKKDLLKAAVIAGAAFGIVGPEAFSGIFGSGAAASTALGAEAAATGLTLAELGGTAGAVGGTTGLLTGGAGATALGTGLTAGSSLSGLTAGSSLSGLTAGTGALTGANTLLGGAALGSTLGALTTGAGALTAGATALTASQIADLTKAGLTATQIGSLLSGGATTVGGLLQQQTSREAAQKAQQMIEAETAAAKTAAQFRPVGMTTRFGTSQFQVDPVTGQLISAGYTASPGVLEAQNRLVALGNQGLAQAEAAQGQFAPLQTGAQNLFNLGNQYIAQSPEAVAQNYLNQQMSLLQPGRELELANLQNKLQQQGRGGLAVAQGGTLGATTPELQALYNARAQQEAQLAANAQQYGQQNVAFGAGLLGTGAQTMGQYYAGQQAAYAPYTTALGQFTNLEQLAQQPLTMGASLAQQSAQAGANMGQLGLRGAQLSTALATGQAATTNPYATVLSGLGSSSTLGQGLGGLLGGGLQSAFSQTGVGSSGFGSGLAYGNQDLGLFL
jgi:hypothetical protein